MKYENLKLYRDQYMELCKKYQRKITQDDPYTFDDGKSAGRWYSNQLYKVYHWRKENKKLTQKQMENVMFIAELDNFLYDNFDKLKVYERRLEEYKQRVLEQKNTDEHSRFTDGVLMYLWYRCESFKYKKWYQEQKELSHEDYALMRMYADLENEVYDKKKVKKR